MNSKIHIQELVSKVLSELQRLNYSEGTCNLYRSFYNQLLAYADSIGETVYSEDLGNRYLKEHYHFDLESHTLLLTRKFRAQVRYIRVLGDYQLHGAILRRRTTKTPYEKTPQFVEALHAYQKECEQRNYSAQGMRTRIYRTRLFIDYLDDRQVSCLSLLTAEHLSDVLSLVIIKNLFQLF